MSRRSALVVLAAIMVTACATDAGVRMGQARGGVPALPSSTVVMGSFPARLPSSSSTSPATTSSSTSSSTTSPSTTSSTTEPTPPRPLRLVFTGDVLMHSPLWRQALRNGGGITPVFTPMFDHIRPVVEAADLAVCHLETPIAPPGEAYSTSPRYGVPAEVVDALAATGFDHCSTASNHTFDRGVAGVDATADRFNEVGITQHGMARVPTEQEPVLVEVDGLTIGLLSATYGFDSGVRPADESWRSTLIDADRIIADAALARSRGAELVVVSLHWGNSNSHHASDSQRQIATRLAESALVDLVIGHHAHVVQPIEQIGAMWVAYGLGNLISNLPGPSGVWGAASRDGLVVEIVVQRASTATVSIAAPIARPVWVDREAGWVVRDLAVAVTDAELVARLGPELEQSWGRTAAVVGDFVVAR